MRLAEDVAAGIRADEVRMDVGRRAGLLHEPKLRHRIEFAAFRVLSRVIGALSERAAHRSSGILGAIVGGVLRVRRSDTDRNLLIAFPERDAAWRRSVARRSYRHFVREAALAIRLLRMEPHEIVSRTSIEGLEAFQEAVAEGKGAIMISGHLGNWEVAAAAMAARGVPMDVLAHRQKNPLFYRHLVELRERLGLTVVVKNDAFRQIPKSLAAGRVVALLADQNIMRRGLFVDFFGRAASTAKGPALFALRTGAPVFLGVALREGGLPSRYRVIIEAVAGAETVRDLTQRHVSRLEARIREAPDQYFWQHRRWKTRPEGTGVEVSEPR